MESRYICRICLESDEDSNLQMLFKDFQENTDIIQKIEICGGIKVEIGDNFPDKICGKCFCALNISYNFRQLCQSTDLQLRNIIDYDDNDEQKFFALAAEFDLAPTVWSSLSNAFWLSSTYLKPDVKEESDRDSLMVTHEPEPDILWEPPNVQITDSNEDDVELKENQKEPVKRKPRKTVFPTPRRTVSKSQDIHMCEHCGNFYKRRCHLMMHMKRHSAVKPYNCEICKKAFGSQSEINRHIRIHTGDKPYKCKYCDRKFSDCSSNTRHERTHTNERPFECNTCGKTFTYSSVLKFHMMVHTGEKRFQCSVCNKTFTRAHQLKQHLLTIIHQQRAAKAIQLKADPDNNNISADSNSSTVE